MAARSYPREDLVILKADVPYRCTNCGESIKAYADYHTDGRNKYHGGCEPQKQPVVKTVVIEDQMDITKDGAA